MNSNFKHGDLTARIIKAFYKVYNTLGYGFLEKVYERSLIIELNKMGMHCTHQNIIRVYYEGNEVGIYSADLLVEDRIIIELKASETLSKTDEPQLLNYLKATKIEVGLLLNFGVKPEIIRKVFSNELKSGLSNSEESNLSKS